MFIQKYALLIFVDILYIDIFFTDIGEHSDETVCLFK